MGMSFSFPVSILQKLFYNGYKQLDKEFRAPTGQIRSLNLTVANNKKTAIFCTL